MSNEFVDLRRGHLSSESFWPSFTDIMMVVVMIFLLTSMILMVRNWKLLDQLRSSMAAEEEAARIIDNTSAENATLEEQLAQAQNEISMLRMQLMQAHEQGDQLKTALDEKEQKIILVLDEKDRLKHNLEQAEHKITILGGKLDSLNRQLAEVVSNIEAKDRKLDEQRQQIIILSREKDAGEKRLAALREDYGSLKVKYDKLIRPARTAKGKYVVSVHYQRVGGKAQIRFKDAGEDSYHTIDSKALHARLARLKKAHPGKLYIKIVIPKDSGLTYSEAWRFMKDLLDKYDYYYQQTPAGSQGEAIGKDKE